MPERAGRAWPSRFTSSGYQDPDPRWDRAGRQIKATAVTEAGVWLRNPSRTGLSGWTGAGYVGDGPAGEDRRMEGSRRGWAHTNRPCPSALGALFYQFLLPDTLFGVSGQPRQGAWATQVRSREPRPPATPLPRAKTRNTILGLAGLTHCDGSVSHFLQASGKRRPESGGGSREEPGSLTWRTPTSLVFGEIKTITPG